MRYLELGEPVVYTVRRISKTLLAGECWARPIIGDNTGKFFVIVGTSQSDLDKLGEIIAVMRTEDPTKTHYQTWDAYTLGRSAFGAHTNILDRMNALEEMQGEHSLVIEIITKYWLDARHNPLLMRYLRHILVLHACKLLNARTSNRLSAGDLVASSSSLVDSLGRYNPGASAAKLTASDTRLDAQLEFDELSRDSASDRGELAEDIERICDDVVSQIVRLLNLGNDESVKHFLPIWFGRILVKPYTYAIRSLFGPRMDSLRASGMDRTVVASTFLLERSLAEVSAMLSIVRGHPEMFIAHQDLIDEIIRLIDIDTALPEYEDLVDRVLERIDTIQRCLDSQDYVSLRAQIRQIKALVRNRDDIMLWPMYNVDDFDGPVHPIYR